MVSGFANIQMNGQEVFKFAVRTVPDTLNKSLAKAKITPEEIDHLVLHQAVLYFPNPSDCVPIQD